MKRIITLVIISLSILVISLSEANEQNENLLRINTSDGYGYIDRHGKIIVKPHYDVSAGLFSEGLAAVPNQEMTKVGYIGTRGQFVIEPQFRNAFEFSEGLAAVQIGELWGYIDKTGNTVINPNFVSACSFSEGLACVSVCDTQYNGCPYGYINKKGEMVIKPLSEPFTISPSSFSEGLAQIRKGEKFGYIDKQGHIVIHPKFDFTADYFSEGLARIRINGKFGYIDKEGQIVIEPRYLDAGSFSEGLAYVKIDDGKYGFIDKQGKMVIPPRYDLILAFTKFSEERACVGMGTKEFHELFGYIDKTGKMIIPPSFHWCDNFFEGLARIKFRGRIGYLDRQGNYIWKPQ